ncbi:GNAT family N-acetyltransferase [Anoxynatronum buryatiense]|uniref:UDP-4-amino-4,6-dideoxy-N-acetyl-beta-L-altrosamine N-acetyltransferase n=1 Tax=Anoxynatronum buryatiense TaxID=489973 RepID=A0AA45WYC6_9CLOT|nr:GNAT family N-acetyltransferase [Anoxynatronum buryatiense]SMP67501.1 UDP-4-amino-4,6-dideoxy-N-acetyl-beta-L-altrosamine N-acetyltransferase [Anoxynatronum buryatiense]
MNRSEYHIRNLLMMEDQVKWHLREWRNQPFVRNQMIQSEEISESAHEAYLQKLPHHPTRQVYLLMEGETPLGVMNLDWFRETDSLEFGFFVIREHDQYRGLGALMEYVILEHAINELAVNEVFCRTLTTNEKTIALHRKFGFQSLGKETLETGNLLLRQSISPQEWQDKKDGLKRMLMRMAPVTDIQWQNGGS